MPRYTTKRRMSFAAAQLYDIVADIESYPQFVPLCRSVSISNRRTSDGVTRLDAEMQITYDKLGISERFRSEVTLDRPQLAIKSVSTERPLKHLESAWRFRGHSKGGSDVHYTVEYQFSSRTLQFLMSRMFEVFTRKMFTAFEARAHALYDKSQPDAHVEHR